MSNIAGKKLIPVYVTESVYREIKVYAAQTDKTIQEVCKIPSEAFEQEAIKLVAQLREMKRQAEEARLKEEETQRIALENPLQVPGHPVEQGTEIESIPA